MILKNKTAVIFASTGGIASEVARVFAANGANLFLSSTNEEKLAKLQVELKTTGVEVETAHVDATDENQVSAYLKRVIGKTKQIDIHFNGIGGHPKDLGYPAKAPEMSVEQFMIPVRQILASTFLTVKETAKYMIEKKTGSIVTLSSTLSISTIEYMSGLTSTCGAIEAMTRGLAGEFGRYGIRVNCVRGSAMPETRTIQETVQGQIALRGEEPFSLSPPPLGRPITVRETANTALFLASNLSSGTTGQVLTVCAGDAVARG